MDQHEYSQWRASAKVALAPRYCKTEVDAIIEWFDRIKGAEEMLLTGVKCQNAINVIRDSREKANDTFDLYGDMMMRVWIYAPLIVQEHRECLARAETMRIR